MTESVFISVTIDAKEGRDVVTVDIPGAFMQTDMEGLVHVKLEGPMAELLAKVDPDLYMKYITIEKGKAVIYVKLKKALYGTLQAALLFWKDLSGKLESWGYDTDPYNPSAINKIINEEQKALLWHVDNIKMLHVNKKMNTALIKKLNNAYHGSIL